MVYGSAILAILSGNMLNGFLAGMNPLGEDGHTLALLMMSIGNGKHAISGDYKSFDGSQSSTTIQQAHLVMERLYPDDDPDNIIRRKLAKAVSESYHVAGPYFEQWQANLPSGWALTTPSNGIINWIVYLTTWIKIHNGNVESLLDFDRHVIPFFQGDDNLASVSEEYSTRFTEVSIAKTAMDFFGMTYTSADKGPPNLIPTSFENHSILKMKFRFEPAVGMWLMALDLDVILERVLWTRQGVKYHDVAQQNLGDTVLDLTAHGKDVYNHWLPRLRNFYGTQWNLKSDDWLTNLRSRSDKMHILL
jgi:hypothetical protein